MTICIPIKDIRDTAKFAELVNSSESPVTITKNGYDQFVVMRSKDYDELAKADAKIKLMERLMIAEHERHEHKWIDAEESLAELKERYGL